MSLTPIPLHCYRITSLPLYVIFFVYSRKQFIVCIFTARRRQDHLALKGPSLLLLGLRLYPLLQVTMVHKMKMGMTHLPIIYILKTHEMQGSLCPKKKEQLIQANKER
ncbi:hypothetical protein ATANTOWER_008530 [Ataeniobius toweri]|uniref:Uncharacterized protein n=1 Tax=Ataeniobius toweri TaxID=208326 RepID=A0ABU7AE02_9TELE|nr:hypothetical protein [Ataeniobius toweri]